MDVCSSNGRRGWNCRRFVSDKQFIIMTRLVLHVINVHTVHTTAGSHSSSRRRRRLSFKQKMNATYTTEVFSHFVDAIWNDELHAESHFFVRIYELI